VAEDKLRDELKRVKQDRGELNKIKALIGADKRVGIHDLSSIESKFIQPAKLGEHKYVPGERSIELVQKKKGASGFSKLKNILRKEEGDLTEIKGLIFSHRKKEPIPSMQGVSLKQIEKMEKTKLAEVERDSKIIEQKPPVSGEAAGTSPSLKEADPGAQAQVGVKTNLNPAAIPISGRELNNKQAKLLVKPGTERSKAGTAEIQPKPEPIAPVTQPQVTGMQKEEAVDSRPLGQIIAEEEARDKEKLAKEIEKEAAQDAKKATEQTVEKPGRWASFINHIKPQHKEQPQAAAQQQAQAAQTAQPAPAQAPPVQAAVQPAAAQQIVLQIPSISSSPGKVTVQEEVDLRKLTMDVEKLGAEFISLKETRTQSDERLQRIAEDVGELRSLFFQREEAFRDTQSTTEKLKSAVEDLEPDKFLKALHKTEGEMMLAQSKIEKLERISEEAGKQLKDAKVIIENVKGIENLKELLKEINTKSSKVEETHGYIERTTNKVEKLYVEIDKKLSEFNTFKAKLITVDELTKELMKIVDEAKIKLDDTPNKSEFATLERGMQEELKKATDSLEGVKQQLVSQLSDIQTKSSEINTGMDNFKQETRMQTTAVQMQFDRELAELRQQALMIIDAVKEEVQRNTINIDELKRMESFVELDRRIREHSLPSASQPFKPELGAKPQPVEEPKPAPRSVSPMELRDSLEDLKKRKAELTRLFDFLEDEYHRGIISERSYRESKENTKNRLAELSRMIEIKSNVLKDLPQSAGADDRRDLYVSAQKVKADVDLDKEGTSVSRLLDVQDRFGKINEMLGALGERRQKIDISKPTAGQPTQKGTADGAQNAGQPTPSRLSVGAGHSTLSRLSDNRHNAGHSSPGRIADGAHNAGHSSVHSAGNPANSHLSSGHQIHNRAPSGAHRATAGISLKDSSQIMSKVNRIRKSLDDKLDAAREHEHNIHHLHKEKERLKKYHPVLHIEKKQ